MSDHSHSSLKRTGDGDNEEVLPSKAPKLSLTPDDFMEIARQVASLMGAQLPPGNQEQPGSDHELPPTNIPPVETRDVEAGEGLNKDPPLSLHPNCTIYGGEISQLKLGGQNIPVSQEWKRTLQKVSRFPLRLTKHLTLH